MAHPEQFELTPGEAPRRAAEILCGSYWSAIVQLPSDVTCNKPAPSGSGVSPR